MDNKENILESWIMVEHLSEGDINLHDKMIKTLSELLNENYYQLFMDEIQKKNLKSNQQGGIVFYFDIFSFSEVIQFLRKEYHLSPTEEEIQVGDKFSFVLYFDKELKLKEKEEWIGIPLWVHRRCKYPMFSIANKISYGGNMVQGVEAKGKTEWYDVCGNATDKYVKEQGEFLREKISEMIKNQPDIIDKLQKDKIYVISPFKNVAFQLAQELKKIDFTRYENGKPTNIGTVHTFQGKEAPIVFMVLGADYNSKGAANWAVGTENPNIMNVAATRAKEEFYIIGDKKLYKNLNSDVITDTYDIINEFNMKSK